MNYSNSVITVRTAIAKILELIPDEEHPLTDVLLIPDCNYYNMAVRWFLIHNSHDKIFKNGPSKICGSLKGYQRSKTIFYHKVALYV